jgi:hypothetical protein
VLGWGTAAVTENAKVANKQRQFQVSLKSKL